MDSTSLLSSTLWIVAASSASYLLYKWSTKNFDYFAKQGIPAPKPIPLYGNLWGIWKKNFKSHDADLARKYGKVFGFFEGNAPNLFICDADFIRSVFVKDFDHFINRRTFEVSSKYFRKLITVIRDDEWKEVRSSATLAFTTGKIKRMSALISKCTDLLVDKLTKTAEESGKFNAKDVFSAYTIDVISKCAFGMKFENLGEEDDPFVKNAKAAFNSPLCRSPLLVIPFLFPKLLKMISDRAFVTKEFMFFLELLINAVKERSSSDVKYHDFIQVATEAISELTKDVGGNQVPTWTREEVDEIVIAQATLFLLAGFDSTAMTLSTACYLLAKNPQVQEKLYEEIMSKLEHYGQVCHEMIVDFPYVDQVIHEVLRLYPPAPRLERQCNKDVTYNGIVIRKGVLVSVPVYADHYSEEYYPNPEKFDPDRWAPENKHKLSPYTFLSFGLGPRNCIGMRFAAEELKIALCSIIKKFRFHPVEETPETLEFEDGLMPVLQPILPIVGVLLRN
nr:CYP360A2 protein [Diaphanosoma celebensis]